ncbi:MAG: mechanosensitive ion channel family protein [Deltaproteobacteria bacterium]|nr:mechanosensitive ion channel family protein [Deltaproteobacteria bacterium]
MDGLLSSIQELLGKHSGTVLRVTLVLAVTIVATRALRRAFARTVGELLPVHQSVLAKRAIGYAIYTLAAVWILRELGFEPSVLLGAAGVATVALGFAAQTSVSNLISGLFLIAEAPFKVGDVIRTEGFTGEVMSIDLLSVKLRTFDNLYVRIPNETLLKTSLTTMTRFPIRRYDLHISVGYDSDLTRVRELLEQVAFDNTVCLDDPKPVFIFQKFAESGIDVQFSVWGLRERYLELRNSISEDVLRALRREGIEIPFPKRSIVGSLEIQNQEDVEAGGKPS